MKNPENKKTKSTDILKKILVVDDEPDIRKTVKEILIQEGYLVKTAVNGDDCLEKIKKEKPDLILLDVMMPGTPVKDVIKQIKDIKIVFLTVVLTSEAEKENLLNRKNVVGFINKPFDIHELVMEVNKIIRY